MPIHLQHLNKDLEPPPIQELAQHMSENTWLDVQVVDAGLLQRVRVEVLHIYRERETVSFVQHSRDDEGATAEYRIEVNGEDIMYAVKSELESSADVLALVETPPEKDPLNLDDGFEALKDAAIQAVVDVTGGTVMALVKSLSAGGNQARQEMVDRRHLVLWAMIEATDATPASLCFDCGWRSPMPFQSAQWKFTGKNGNPEKWAPVIKKVMAKVDTILGKKRRRSDGDRWKDICVT